MQREKIAGLCAHHILDRRRIGQVVQFSQQGSDFIQIFFVGHDYFNFNNVVY